MLMESIAQLLRQCGFRSNLLMSCEVMLMSMENVTIAWICGGLAVLVGFIKGVKFLKKSIKDFISELLKEQFGVINGSLASLQTKIDAVDMGTTKNFLVARISDVEKGSDLDEIARERFWEQYEHYCSIGGNSYIRVKVEQLKADGRL